MRFALIAFSSTLFAGVLQAADFYVCAATGKGKAATREEPAKDLGNVISMLKPGDTVHIAEGFYTGRADNGSDQIAIPVSVIGGYSADFTKRDPWGAHRTVLGGDNKSKNWDAGPRLAVDCQKFKDKGAFVILVDGIIVDNASRNRYSGADRAKIERKTNPAAGENPTSERGGIRVVAPAKQRDPSLPKDVLVISKALKEYIRAASDLRTSDAVMDVLSEKLRDMCDRAIERAKADERKTVLDRDFLPK